MLHYHQTILRSNWKWTVRILLLCIFNTKIIVPEMDQMATTQKQMTSSIFRIILITFLGLLIFVLKKFFQSTEISYLIPYREGTDVFCKGTEKCFYDKFTIIVQYWLVLHSHSCLGAVNKWYHPFFEIFYPFLPIVTKTI